MARYSHQKDVVDLQMSISPCERAVSLTPFDNPRLSVRLKDLGNSLVTRCKGAKQEADNNKAISSLQQAVETTPSDHQYKSLFLIWLIDALLLRFNALHRRSVQVPMRSGPLHRHGPLLGAMR